MDLSHYKKAWENQPEEKNKVSALEIYKMTQAKSTSIVKWILIIGLLEFVFWTIINHFVSELDYNKVYAKLDLTYFFEYSYYLGYIIVVIFLYFFYRNYTSVSTTDNTKTLMRKIIKVRRTVKFYVYFNISISILAMIILNILIANTPNGIETLLRVDQSSIDSSDMITIYIASQVIGAIIMILILLLFYYLLYGLLLKKLNKNYKDLTKLDEAN
tara:strand:+ start:111883 stop:112527 length:645 start_codon:yes stop_codon:yes gene_type:complete